MSQAIGSSLERLAEGGFRRVSLGLKPSGKVHIGTALTFMQGMLAVKASLQQGTGAHLDAMVMDLDHDLKRGLSHWSFLHRPDNDGCHALARQHTYDETGAVLSEITGYFGMPDGSFRVGYFSDVAVSPVFMDYMRFMFLAEDGRNLLRATVHPENGGYNMGRLISPICECGHSSAKAPRVSADGQLFGLCYNPRCMADFFEVGMTEQGRVNVFYLIDPVRDAIPDADGARADLHVFGGDYGSPYGISGVPKAARVQALMEGLAGYSPLIHVGPELRMGGFKLGKSVSLAYDVASVRQRFPDWVGRLHSLLMGSRGSGAVDVLDGGYFS